ncbi:MAG: hypothetical protein M3R38_02245 [Actinomycetota bacterium]|nr:hypothetical protein [Actinomycetota bacterium]
MGQCAGITAAGGRCKGQAIGNSQYCFSHSPDHAEARRQRASKGGKRGGRGRPQAELANLKGRLSALADDVLAGKVDRGDAAVVSQILNTYIRAVGVELRVREQQDLVERLEALERATAQKEGKRWGA